MSKPLTAELVWSDRLRFGATSGPSAIVIDADGVAGPSPMQLAAFALAGCMAADVVAILQKKRQPLTGLRVSFSANRAPDPPRRFVEIDGLVTTVTTADKSSEASISPQ